MEYLMTYGWAILIIAVVLSVLFQLGVFSSGNFQPHAQAGSCQVSSTAAGKSLEGQCNGMLPQYVASFSGTTSSYIYANAASLPTGSAARTITAWVYINAPGSNLGVAGWGSVSSEEVSDLGEYPSTNVYFWEQGPDCTNGPTIPTKTWAFIAVTYATGATTATLYSDSNSQSGCSMSALNTPSGTQLYIGNGPSNSWPFGGQIANIQIYNTSLSSSEIQALYLEGIGGAPIRPQNIVGWWPLNGNANDYSGNGNNGQLNGVTFSSSWEGSYTAP